MNEFGSTDQSNASEQLRVPLPVHDATHVVFAQIHGHVGVLEDAFLWENIELKQFKV